MIQPKKKSCKGSGKAKDFNGCGQDVFKRVYGLCQSCYAKWLYNTPEGLEKLSKATLKVKQPKLDLAKAKAEKAKKNTLQSLLINVRTVCHEYIRLRDKGKPCVSCGQSWSSDHQAGHWKKAELYPSLKFDERNIHNQCQGCNLFNDGNVQKYSDNIHTRITQAGKEELERIAADEKKISFKWDREKLNAVREYYRMKIKQLKEERGIQ